MKFSLVLLLLLVSLFGSVSLPAQNATGIFDQTTDVGPVLHPGKTEFNGSQQSYRLSGSGTNIWFKKDEFHYAFQRVPGNVILQCRGKLLGQGVDPHRKFGWMMRAGLDTAAAMVCATVHGDGLTAIQYRKRAGANIEEVKSPVNMPDVIELERRGRSFFLSVARFGEPFWTVEVPDFELPVELYAGLFVCSHHKDVVETAEFDNVRVVVPARANFQPYRDYIGSHIEVVDVTGGQRQVLFSDPGSLQAPNWTPDDKSLIYNKDGLIYRFDLASRKTKILNTDFVRQNNNDHVLSFDGKQLGLSSSSGDARFGSMIYTVPVGGGKPKQITPTGPSYLHGWSPDGKWLTYTAQRNNDYDIYKMKATGGQEIRLTSAPGLDDGSEYSPDGKYIYFNSVRSGKMQLWRMKTDGKGPEQLTDDAFNNWFPHVSPDGQWIVFLSYPPETAPDDHPFYKHVYLRKMPVAGGKPTVLAYFYGGQGSINTPSWSPDGKRVAFVSNSVVEPEAPWQYLLNDKDLSGWDTYLGAPFPAVGEDRTGVPPIGLNRDPQQVFRLVTEDGAPALRISGEQFGGISTVQAFANYHLQLQFKWGKQKWHPREKAKMDSGVLYHANGEHGADYGFWMQSQEFQVQEGDCGDYWGVAGAVFDVPAKKQGEKDWVYDPKGELLTFAEKSPNGRHCIKNPDGEKASGEWNTLDLYCSGDTAVHVVNGQLVMALYHSRRPEGAGMVPLTKGKIQLQSEGAEVFYRSIRLRPIGAIPQGMLKN